MEIKLAGTNVPIDVLKSLPESERAKATPEVISAAYARISRSQKNVDELVEEASQDSESARRSVTSVLGMGHQSIADHAIFNLNIQGVSRLLAESIEKRRLAGYTEKSQRYVTLKGDFIRPKEYSEGDLERFEALVAFQNDFYFRTNPKLLEHLKKKFPDKDEKALEGSAKEDARYALCLATEAQLGCSYTGQTAELAIRELRHGRLAEEREFSQLLYNAIVGVAPSLIQLSDPELFKKFNDGKELKDENFKYCKSNLEKLVKKTFDKNKDNLSDAEYNLNRLDGKFLYDKDMTLMNSNKHDNNVITALLHENSRENIETCYAMADYLIKNNKARDFIKESARYLSEFDKVPRAFEISGFIYEFPLSSSGFAQLKRHRTDTLLAQDYNPELGIVIPPNIVEISADKELKDVCDRSADLYYNLFLKYGKAAEYCLTNAHKRRVIFATNLRQGYHLSRIREDGHAQWEIRGYANSMARLAKQVAPVTTMLLGGKDKFPAIRAEAFRLRILDTV
jgi:thymidylate synthase ThyX